MVDWLPNKLQLKIEFLIIAAEMSRIHSATENDFITDILYTLACM